jgi:hypothetical protein
MYLLRGDAVSDGTIGNVKAMCRDEGAPTAPLAEFLEAYNDDNNWWWQISCGHHMNLFDAAVDEIERLKEEIAVLSGYTQTAHERGY